MKAISIQVELEQGMTLVDVLAKQPSEWRRQGVPEFFVAFRTPQGITSMILQRERGTWYDQVPQVAKTVTYLDYLAEGWDDWWNPDYKSPLTSAEIQLVGQLINAHILEMSRFTWRYLAA